MKIKLTLHLDIRNKYSGQPMTPTPQEATEIATELGIYARELKNWTAARCLGNVVEATVNVEEIKE